MFKLSRVMQQRENRNENQEEKGGKTADLSTNIPIITNVNYHSSRYTN